MSARRLFLLRDAQSGTAFRINIVKGSSGSDLTTILAQSNQFTVNNPSKSSASPLLAGSSYGMGVTLGLVGAGVVAGLM